MARQRVRSQNEAVRRCEELAGRVRSGLERLAEAPGDAAAVDDVWSGEALGALMWALQLAELPPYDRPFDPVEELALGDAELRPVEELEQERSSARLWHWRARTAELQRSGETQLPERYATFDQLIAATAMHGHELGLLPAPARGDFPASGRVYRHLSSEQVAEARSIAAERQRALEWLLRPGCEWDDVPLDT